MTITVRIPGNNQSSSNHVTIIFADNGAGITPDVLPRIFDPFFTTKPGEQGGTGLGLHISYNLVTQKMGGAMRVQSQEGAGTRFVITLPTVYTEEMSSEAAE